MVRPDASIVKGDGSQTPGFDAVTSDGVGGFVYNYLTNPEPTEIDGRYDVTVYATSDVAHTNPLATAIFYVDDSAYPTSITKTFAGLQLSLNGNWKWPNCGTSYASKKHVGVEELMRDDGELPEVRPDGAEERDLLEAFRRLDGAHRDAVRWLVTAAAK